MIGLRSIQPRVRSRPIGSLPCLASTPCRTRSVMHTMPTQKQQLRVLSRLLADAGLSSAGALDEDQLPLLIADGGGSNMLLWDREEMSLNDTPDTPDSDLGFSPGGSAGTPADTFVLNREVNVIMFNDGNVLGTADLQDEDLGLGFVVNVSGEGNPSDRGWSALVIEEVADEMIWTPEDLAFGTDIDPNDDVTVTGRLGLLCGLLHGHCSCSRLRGVGAILC